MPQAQPAAEFVGSATMVPLQNIINPQSCPDSMKQARAATARLIGVGCSGVVIDRAWVFTAAHCVQGQMISDVELLNEGTKALASARCVHGGFAADGGGFTNDIAALKLGNLVGTGSSLSRSDIATHDPSGTVRLIAWDNTGGSLECSREMPFHSDADCDTHHTDTSVGAGEFCAGGVSNGGMGGSGGPLIQVGSAKLIGLLSDGFNGDADPFDVYVDLDDFRDWIDRVVEGNSPRCK